MTKEEAFTSNHGGRSDKAANRGKGKQTRLSPSCSKCIHQACANQKDVEIETLTQPQALYVTNLGRRSERARGS